MKKPCPRGGECILPPDMRTFVDLCPNESSQYMCGPARVYNEVTHKLHGMEFEDVLAPITHTVEVVRAGGVRVAPSVRGYIDIGSAFVGLVFPVRRIAENAERECGEEVSVTHLDAWLSAFAQGRTLPYVGITPDRDTTDITWTFGRGTVATEVVEEDMSSLDFYGQFASSALKACIDATLFEEQDGLFIPKTGE